MSLQRALLLLIAVALVAGIVPGNVLIDRRLAREVESRARADLAQAPRLQADGNAGQTEAMLMHARDVARAPELIDALVRGEHSAAVRAAEVARADFGDGSIIINTLGMIWAGPMPSAGVVRALLDRVQRGETPSTVVADSGTLHMIALVPVQRKGIWLGAAGVSVTLGKAAAGTLAGLTRSDVLFLGNRGTLLASTANDDISAVLATHASRIPHDGSVHLVADGNQQYLLSAIPTGDVGVTVFAHDFTRDLSILPAFRRIIVFSGVAALLLGLLLGTRVARRIARPVMALADAADRLTAGDADAPLMHSSIREIDRLSEAFTAMRQTLALRISDVTGANRRLTDRQTRLETSQSEILQRERLAVSTRLVAELSHEIRNPIANLRNCLEIIRRRVGDDPRSLQFTELAIDELLRMHELAEQLLDLNRPRDPAVRNSNVDNVVHEVTVLASAGSAFDALRITVDERAGDDVVAKMAPDALKQVLLNLVQNGREALAERPPDDERPGLIALAVRHDDSRVIVTVSDNGPGIANDVLPRIFDPFFTTKGAVHGIGLGLFVAEGLVRTAGGTINVTNRPAGGAEFRIELPRGQKSES